ncbi:MAG: hypothetical protein EOP52_03835 [Sphingobacteriales bacterium]|nr:MAG: hypothetical protein EOP52_03835 [Sphingobacteriales bacterium]
MIKHVLLAAGVAGCLTATLTGCTKEEPQTYQVSFYTPTPNQPLRLYVEGADWGMLPYLAQTPSCPGTQSDGAKALVKPMASGEYRVECRNAQGAVVNQGTIRMSTRSMGSSGTMGGGSMQSNESCVAVGLWY